METVKIKIEQDKHGIDSINISEMDIYKVVLFWYTELEPNIFQNEDGEDLEEVLENLVY